MVHVQGEHGLRHPQVGGALAGLQLGLERAPGRVERLTEPVERRLRLDLRPQGLDDLLTVKRMTRMRRQQLRQRPRSAPLPQDRLRDSEPLHPEPREQFHEKERHLSLGHGCLSRVFGSRVHRNAARLLVRLGVHANAWCAALPVPFQSKELGSHPTRIWRSPLVIGSIQFANARRTDQMFSTSLSVSLSEKRVAEGYITRLIVLANSDVFIRSESNAAEHAWNRAGRPRGNLSQP